MEQTIPKDNSQGERKNQTKKALKALGLAIRTIILKTPMSRQFTVHEVIDAFTKDHPDRDQPTNFLTIVGVLLQKEINNQVIRRVGGTHFQRILRVIDGGRIKPRPTVTSGSQAPTVVAEPTCQAVDFNTGVRHLLLWMSLKKELLVLLDTLNEHPWFEDYPREALSAFHRGLFKAGLLDPFGSLSAKAQEMQHQLVCQSRDNLANTPPSDEEDPMHPDQGNTSSRSLRDVWRNESMMAEFCQTLYEQGQGTPVSIQRLTAALVMKGWGPDVPEKSRGANFGRSIGAIAKNHPTEVIQSGKPKAYCYQLTGIPLASFQSAPPAETVAPATPPPPISEMTTPEVEDHSSSPQPVTIHRYWAMDDDPSQTFQLVENATGTEGTLWYSAADNTRLPISLTKSYWWMVRVFCALPGEPVARATFYAVHPCSPRDVDNGIHAIRKKFAEAGIVDILPKLYTWGAGFIFKAHTIERPQEEKPIIPADPVPTPAGSLAQPDMREQIAVLQAELLTERTARLAAEAELATLKQQLLTISDQLSTILKTP